MTPVAGSSLLSSKVWYFCSYAAAACIIPFLNLYFQRLGFSKDQIGLLTALRPWLSAVSGNVFAVAADHLAAHKVILLATYGVTAALRFSLSTVQSFGLMLALVVLMEVASAPVNIIVDASVISAGGERKYGRARLWGAVGWGCLAPVAGAVVARSGIRAAFLCNVALAALGFLPTVLLPIGALRKQRPDDAGAPALAKTNKNNPPPGSRYDVQADAAARGTMFAAAADTLVAAEAGDAGGAAAGGEQRPALPASSWGLPAELPPSSPAGDAWQDGALIREVAAHVPLISAPELLVPTPPLHLQVYDLHAATWLAPHERPLGELVPADKEQPPLCSAAATKHGTGDEEPRFAFGRAGEGAGLETPLLSQDPIKVSELSLVRKALLVLSSPDAVTFFCIAVLMGYGMGTIDSFLFLFLDELGGSELLMGLTITITCVAEVPVFFFTGWLLEAVGVHAVLHGVLAVYILRLAYYSVLQYLVTPWAVLPIELLHGVTFGLAWAAGTINCSRISPPGLETVTQAIFQGLFSGVGLGLGGLVGGLIYHRCGAPAVFASAALVLAGGWCLCGLVQALVKCWRSCSRGKA